MGVWVRSSRSSPSSVGGCDRCAVAATPLLPEGPAGCEWVGVPASYAPAVAQVLNDAAAA